MQKSPNMKIFPGKVHSNLKDLKRSISYIIIIIQRIRMVTKE